ncbi:MAG: glycosyltransferase [Crocinitomicaceae bacterium]|nr:glycosyltransferase [Crocinitomicaceae bacterium]
MPNPLVSISCITYNHALFIRECFEGFLMQKTNFEFEILVHDDASTDGTAEIIKEYEANYPHLFKVIYQTENQYSKGIKTMNPRFNYPRARGKYIALCEGDDYWTDPYKLQKQVDFLEANEDYSICFHEVKILKENELIDDYITREVSETSTIKDLAYGNYMHTNTVVFRRLKENYPEWFLKVNAGDYSLHLYNAQFGKIKKIKEVMSVYRIHHSNIWVNQNSTAMNSKIHHDLNIIIEHLDAGITPILLNRFEKISHSLIHKYTESQKQNEAKEILCKLIEKKPEKYLNMYMEAIKPPSIREHFKIGFKMIMNKFKK